MPAPAYNKAFSPIKNLQLLLRALGATSIATTIHSAIAQLLHRIHTTALALDGTLSVAGLTTVAAFTRTGVEKVAPSATPANITTGGAGTYTAANLATGIITRDPNGAGRTDTTDTATNLVAGLALTANYQERFCTIVNTADANETITLAGGTGVTLKGAITCEQNTAIRIAMMRTSATTVTIRQV